MDGNSVGPDHSADLDVYRGAYMSAYVLLILLTSWGKEIKCGSCRAFYLCFHKVFNKFNNTGARMLDSIYYMTLRLL